MALNKIIISLFILFTITKTECAELVKLSTKQSVNNLRYISKNGKFTYFQRRSGSLLLSTNYKAVEVVKGSLGSQYSVIGSRAQKKLIISQDPYYNNFYGIRHNLKLHQVEYGGMESKEIGVGLNPVLHLDDNWVSFYDSHLKNIFFKNLNSESLSFKILLGNSLNPYFIPQAEMISEDLILFTDINNQGIPGVILFNRKNNSLTPFYKSKTYNSKVEICSNSTHFFIGVFGLNRTGKFSSIIKFDKKNMKPDKGESIYSSNRNDFGQMICNYDEEGIYFIKNYSSDKKEKYEIAQLTLSNKEIKSLSSVGVASSLVQMDGLLLLPFRGDYFIVKGNATIVNDSILVNPKVPAPIVLKVPTPTPHLGTTNPTTPTPTPETSGPSEGDKSDEPHNTVRPELPGLK